MSSFTTPGIQTVTIENSGTYDITADGAEGGGAAKGFQDSLSFGGSGAAVSGDVVLQAGTKLEIVVGGEGGNGEFAGGGGGGSFVIDEADHTILAVAGGGGGASYLDSSVTKGTEIANTNEGDGFVTITDVVCYVAGTRILTDGGEIAVEKLTLGDLLVTASGAHRPVRWLGSRRVDCARHPEPSAVWPVRIEAGAFAPQLPARDLWVSPGHSIFVDGVLIQAEKLVNGATITQVPLASVEYWHVELDRHDVILAEGLAAESYLDTGNRTGFFNNGGAFLEAHPDFKPKHWAETCVPLVFEGAAVQKARGDLRDRAAALGYALTEDPDAHVLVDGRRVDPLRLGAERVAFLLPEGGSHIELHSRTFIPAHITPENTDPRSLGLCVFRLQINGEVVALDDEAQFRSGWYGLERYEHGRQQRWSGDRMPLPAGARLLVIDMHPQNPVYWRESAVAAVAKVQGSSRVAARPKD